MFKETASGAKLDRVERRKVMAFAQRREIDAVLVTELSAAEIRSPRSQGARTRRQGPQLSAHRP
jgi:hypothetical protein